MADRKSNARSSSRRPGRGDEFADYLMIDPRDLPPGPDVLLGVPVVTVDEMDIEVETLRAQAAVIAEVRQLVKLSVGADTSLGRVELKIEGVEAQALLKARLDNVALILERVLTTLDRNPRLLESVGRTVERVGEGGERLLTGTGEAVGEVGEGAVQDVGGGARQAVGQVGQGASRGIAGVGQGAQQATEGLAHSGTPSQGKWRKGG